MFRKANIVTYNIISKRFNHRHNLPSEMKTIPAEYRGPSYEKTEEIKAKHMPPALFNMYKRPLLLHHGHMQWLYDHTGKQYLDLIGGICTVSVGHCHPKVVSALLDQLKNIWHTTTLYRHPKIYEYLEHLATKLPGDLEVVYLVNSGTEATDLANVLAKTYTGNNDIISLQYAYHGHSSAIMAMSANSEYRMPIPMPSGYHHVMLPDPYRGLWKACRDSLSQVPGACTDCDGDCVATDKYIQQLEQRVLTSVPRGGVAAFFAESIQGANGVVQFPKGYLRRAKELIKQHGGVYVADEVQTGWGRTGDHFWGFEGHGIIPDIMTVAKGIGNGFPMAAVITTKEIAEAHLKAIYFNTFGGGALAATAGKAVLERCSRLRPKPALWPLLLHHGHMQWLYDHTGKQYLDLIGGICTVSVGHCHPKVVSALLDQLKNIWHTTTLYRHPKIYEYLEHLATKLPGDLEVVYLVNSGTEATDLANVLAKTYTGNNDIISLQYAYHGHSSAIMAMSANSEYRMPIPMPSGYHHVMLPDPYRGLWKACRDSLSQVPGACTDCDGDCVATDKYIQQLEQRVLTSVPRGGVAAFFAESIQGANGVVQFPKGYLRRAKELIKQHGGVYVADEVQTGWGRTGDHFWGFEGHGIIPDIMTVAKGIGNGFPMAAVITTKEIAEAHLKAIYFNTFGGGALAATAGKAVLEVIEEENLQQNCKEVGKYFIEQLMELQKVHPIIGDVRGKGLMLGLELVQPGTKKPLNPEDLTEINESVKDAGVLLGWHGGADNVMRIEPPMCLCRQDVDRGVAVLDDVFKNYLKNKRNFN